MSQERNIMDENKRLKPRMARLEGILGVQTVFLLAAIGYVLFGS